MSWKNVLKEDRVKDSDRKFSEEVFEEIKIVLKKLTGEDWDDVFGTSKKMTLEEALNSKSNKLLDEYHDENPPVWEHDLYSPHLLRWLKKKM